MTGQTCRIGAFLESRGVNKASRIPNVLVTKKGRFWGRLRYFTHTYRRLRNIAQSGGSGLGTATPIPFHNPYRKSSGFWNPLRRGRKGASTNRILAIVNHQPWTHGDLKLWTEWLNPNGTLRTGARELIEATDD